MLGKWHEKTGILRDAGALVYRSLLYLSQYPFYRSIPKALIYEELIRALAWTMPEKSRDIYVIKAFRCNIGTSELDFLEPLRPCPYFWLTEQRVGEQPKQGSLNKMHRASVSTHVCVPLYCA